MISRNLRPSGRRGCQGRVCLYVEIEDFDSRSAPEDDALKECEEQADYWQCRVNELKSGVRTLAADAEEDQTT